MVSPTSKLRKKQDISEKGQGVRGHVVGGKGDDGGYVREGHTSGGRGKMEIGKMQSRGNAEVAEMVITDLAHVDDACNGLNDSGECRRVASVGEWRA